MPYKIDPDTLGFVITDVARLMRQEFDRLIVESGLELTPGETRTLSHAARAGEVRQAALAELMGVEAMTVSGFLDRLEARGLVERVADPADRRAKLVRVTESADALLIRMREVSQASRRRATDGFTPEETELLQSLMRRVRANLSGAREEDRKKSAA